MLLFTVPVGLLYGAVRVTLGTDTAFAAQAGAWALILAGPFVGRIVASRRLGRRGEPQSPEAVGWPPQYTASTVVFQPIYLTSAEQIEEAGQRRPSFSGEAQGGAEARFLGVSYPTAIGAVGRLAVGEHGILFEAMPFGKIPLVRVNAMLDDLHFTLAPHDVISIASSEQPGLALVSAAPPTRIHVRTTREDDLRNIVMWIGLPARRKAERRRSEAFMRSLRSAFPHAVAEDESAHASMAHRTSASS